MKKTLLILFLIIFFIQYSFLPFLCTNACLGSGVVITFIVALALKGEFQSSLVWAFFCGLFVDYFSTVPLGTHSLILISVVGIIELYKVKLAQSKHKKRMTFVSMFAILIIADILAVAIYKVNLLWGEEITFLLLDNVGMANYAILKGVLAVFGVLISLVIGKIFNVFGMYSRDIKL